MSADFSLRAYRAADEDACIALWLRTWAAAYPDIDFAARLDWWRARWRTELVPAAAIAIAEARGAKDRTINRTMDRTMIGFVTVDARGYLDQIVVEPALWRSGVGSALIAQAKRIAPEGLDLDVNIDNAAAIAFYRKCGFAVSGAGNNPISGKPVHRMSWRP